MPREMTGTIMKITDAELNDFYANNQDFDLSKFDFIAQDSAQTRKKNRTSKTLPPTLNKALRAYQRPLRLSGSQSAAQWLTEQGFSSGHHIAAVPKSLFVTQVAPHLEGDFAELLHDRATHVKHQVTHIWANLLASRPESAATRPRASTVTEDTLAELQALPSYAYLFGNQNFCTCEDCKSIFGPAPITSTSCASPMSTLARSILQPFLLSRKVSMLSESCPGESPETPGINRWGQAITLSELLY